MARPTKTDRPVPVKISFPETIFNTLQLELYSSLEEKVPYGAVSDFVVAAVEEKLKKLARKAKRVEDGQTELNHESAL